MVEAGLVSALGIILLMLRFNIKRIAGHAAFFDVTVSGLLVWMFVGTYAGMMTGLFAGVIVSAFLHLIKLSVGTERLVLRRKKGRLLPFLRWEEESRRRTCERGN